MSHPATDRSPATEEAGVLSSKLRKEIRKESHSSSIWLIVRAAGMLTMGIVLNNMRQTDMAAQADIRTLAAHSLECSKDQESPVCETLTADTEIIAGQSPGSPWPMRIALLVSSGAISLSYIAQLKRQGRSLQLVGEQVGEARERIVAATDRFDHEIQELNYHTGVTDERLGKLERRLEA